MGGKPERSLAVHVSLEEEGGESCSEVKCIPLMATRGWHWPRSSLGLSGQFCREPAWLVCVVYSQIRCLQISTASFFFLTETFALFELGM